MAADFRAEVEKVRTWLTTNRWVDQYEFWWSEGGVISALQEFLTRVPPENWSDDDVTDILYVLEQANTDYIAELVAQNESTMLAIAKHSLARGGVAGDDIAEQLGYCVQLRDEAEVLLIAFMRNEHERTRRMALLSLAHMQSPSVLACAKAAWESGDEYSQMGALSALNTVGSDLFASYLSQALADRRENLLALARRYADELAKDNSYQLSS